MKNTFVKLLALALALMLLLCGCGKDPMKELEEQRAEIEKDMNTVLAEYDGGTITKFDVMAALYGNYSYMSQFYAAMGITVDAESMNILLKDVVETEMMVRATSKQFEERGLTMARTEEEINAEADEAYQGYYDYVYEGIEAETDEVRAATVDLTLYSEGLTKDYLRNYLKANEHMAAVEEAVRAEITEVTDAELQAAYEEKVVSDEETYTTSPTRLENDMLYEDSAVCWMPGGYRTVKHVLVIPEEDVLTAVTDAREALASAQAEVEALQQELDALQDDDPVEAEDAVAAETEETAETAAEEVPAEAEETAETAATEAPVEIEEAAEVPAESAEVEETAEGEAAEDARTAETVQKELDVKTAGLADLEAAVADAEAACLASVQSDLDVIYGKLEEGKSFDAVMEVFGEDPGMQREPVMSDGYYVCADSVQWDANFKAGAMLLENVGDYSAEPVISTSGVHIIYYNADVPAGVVALEEVHDALYDLTLETKRTEHYNAQVEEWIAALNPVYHLDAWVFE